METRDLNCWDEFRPLIQEIRDRYGFFSPSENYTRKNTVLFRGHGEAKWPLNTTLERFSQEKFTVLQYMLYASRCANELESVTGKKWNVPPKPQIESEITTNQDSTRVHLPCYEYLVYLRHHGFPSPLLDWTTSPYIAAYFAYYEKHQDERVAVYAYIERPCGSKGGTGGDPQIKLMGPYVSTHSRHFAQKAWYTISTKYDYDANRHSFCSHSSSFEHTWDNQDILIKITMPNSDRIKALEELNDYNINHYTLFQTEDALVKALAIKEFELKHIIVS